MEIGGLFAFISPHYGPKAFGVQLRLIQPYKLLDNEKILANEKKVYYDTSQVSY